MINHLKRGYKMARMFNRGRIFAALMGLSFLLFKRTPKYKVYWRPE